MPDSATDTRPDTRADTAGWREFDDRAAREAQITADLAGIDLADVDPTYLDLDERH